MATDEDVLRSADVIGQRAYDLSGGYLGRVADILVVRDADGVWVVREVVVTAAVWGRLLGYEEAQMTGPWPLLVLAHRLVRRNLTSVPWSRVRVGDPGDT
jgi:hypothetical protein